MGFAETECKTASMISGNTVQLKCRAGQLSDLVDWGIATHFEDKMQCTRQKSYMCTDILDDRKLRQQFQKVCHNKASCNLTDFDQLLAPTSKDLTLKCTRASSRIFFQYQCKQPKELLDEKATLAGTNIKIEIAC